MKALITIIVASLSLIASADYRCLFQLEDKNDSKKIHAARIQFVTTDEAAFGPIAGGSFYKLRNGNLFYIMASLVDSKVSKSESTGELEFTPNIHPRNDSDVTFSKSNAFSNYSPSLDYLDEPELSELKLRASCRLAEFELLTLQQNSSDFDGFYALKSPSSKARDLCPATIDLTGDTGVLYVESKNAQGESTLKINTQRQGTLNKEKYTPTLSFPSQNRTTLSLSYNSSRNSWRLPSLLSKVQFTTNDNSPDQVILEYGGDRLKTCTYYKFRG